MKKITLSTHLTLEDFRKLSFYLLYKQPAIRLLSGIGVFLITCVLLLFFLTNMELFSVQGFAIGLVITFMMPTITFLNLRKNYTSNQRISEKMTYEFEEFEMSINGESFSSTLTWDKVYKVSRSKYFILIWQTKKTANAIPIRDFPSEELKSLEEIVTNVKGLKVIF